MRDVVVVGAGPAGLAVAIGAARAGLSVEVLDKRGDELDKACGEGVMPGALAALHRLGVDPAGHPITGITYRRGTDVVSAAFSAGPGRGVRRTVLSAALRQAAADAGVLVRHHAAGTVTQTAEHVSIDGRPAARHLVAADGLHSPVRRALGLDVAASSRSRWGQRRHYHCVPWTDRVEVTWAGDAEVYVTPVAPGTVGVAVLSSARAGFDELLTPFADVRARLAAAESVSTVRGAGPLRQPVTARVAGRIALVGDAAGYVDALTGEGLAVSFAAAEELVRCLVTGELADYERRWHAVTRRSRWLTAGLLWTRHRPLLAPHIVPAARRLPWVFAAAVDQLAGGSRSSPAVTV